MRPIQSIETQETTKQIANTADKYDPLFKNNCRTLESEVGYYLTDRKKAEAQGKRFDINSWAKKYSRNTDRKSVV